jgi:hypothetical protein
MKVLTPDTYLVGRQQSKTRRSFFGYGLRDPGCGADASVAEIAKSAHVSRRTVYVYFPTLKHLLADADLEARAPQSSPASRRTATLMSG